VCAGDDEQRARSGAWHARVVAKHFVVAGGAINSPALLMRSKLPDPHGLLGKRTFLHPVTLSSAVFEERIEGWQGAPQTMYSDYFLDVAAIDGPIGYKLEAPPLHPVISALALPGFGDSQAAAMKDFPHTHALLALLRDGFHAAVHRRASQAARRWHGGAGLPHHALCHGRRAPLPAEHGRDPVCRRRQACEPGARKGHRPTAAGPKRARPSRSCRWTRNCWPCAART
jgi:hypothetical protein